MKSTLLKLSLMASTCMTLANCNNSSDSGNMANVDLVLGQYSTASHKHQLHPWMRYFIPTAQAAITPGSLKFCFKRLRLKTVDDVADDSSSSAHDSSHQSAKHDSSDDSSSSSIDDSADDSSYNVDFLLGEVTIDQNGTNLASLSAPAGEYRRIEFDLENDCASGKSIALENSNGSFYTDQRVTIKFEGNFTVEEGGQIILPIATIVAALDAFQPTAPSDQNSVAAELKNAAETIGQ